MLGHTHLFWSLSGLFSDRFFHTKLDIGCLQCKQRKLKILVTEFYVKFKLTTF